MGPLPTVGAEELVDLPVTPWTRRQILGDVEDETRQDAEDAGKPRARVVRHECGLRGQSFEIRRRRLEGDEREDLRREPDCTADRPIEERAQAERVAGRRDRRSGAFESRKAPTVALQVRKPSRWVAVDDQRSPAVSLDGRAGHRVGQDRNVQPPDRVMRRIATVPAQCHGGSLQLPRSRILPEGGDESALHVVPLTQARTVIRSRYLSLPDRQPKLQFPGPWAARADAIVESWVAWKNEQR